MAVDRYTSSSLPDATNSLEDRLQRIEFYLYGSYGDRPDIAEEQQRDHNVFSRIERAQNQVNEWSRKSQAFADLLSLYQFHVDFVSNESLHRDVDSPEIKEQLPIVNSYTTIFPTVVSQLTSIQDLPIPPAEAYLELASLLPRIEKVQQRHEVLEEEIARLRVRCAAVLQRWYEVTILAGGEFWVELERRLLEVEKVVRRKEVVKRNEEAGGA